MQRRDLLRGTLVLSSAGFWRFAWGHAVPSKMATLSIRLERDTDMIGLGGGYAGEDIWCLPAGQWLDPEGYAAFIRGRTGRGLCTVLDAGNHCLLREALRRHGGYIQGETRQRWRAGEWRYLLYASV